MTKKHTDKFYLTSLSTHLKWIFDDLKRGEIYGIPSSLFFKPKAGDPFKLKRYGCLMESPIGVAAGPQTQLTQNIVAAWLTGARYLELKTIQVLDELEVTKPCIDMADEGYNCEWSQELKLDQSFDEYLNAFIIIYILKDKLQIGSPDEPGFLFNMSAGYNLEGIKSPTVQRFFDRMTDCSKELAAKQEEAAKFYPKVKQLKIPSKMSDNLTVSTMHGCPPDEVEKIGAYFIEERRFHTTIKLNPTLIGPERLRDILNNKLGYTTQVPDEAFGHDLKYPDGMALIKNLIGKAQKSGVDFAIKLTNTLETQNELQNLPKNEGMVYMSGRSLHGVSINLAAKVQSEFGGALDISFSGGIDYKNIAPVIASGLKPVTVSSDALKPGGYGRMYQYLENLGQEMSAAGAKTIDEYVLISASGEKDPAAARVKNLTKYAAQVLEDPRYKKDSYPYKNGVKTDRPLPKFNCAVAPCREACPASQDVPLYIRYTAAGRFDLAYQTILATNPFPNTQGQACDHKCQSKCTRINYDEPVKIRDIKRFIAENHKGDTGLQAGKPNGQSVAVIGAGPSGLSAAHYLALSGFKVDVFEAKAKPGGMAAWAIPPFRLDASALNKDIDTIISLGCNLHLNQKVDKDKLLEMRGKYNYIYLAIGAQDNTSLNLKGEDAQGVFNQLEFLSLIREGRPPQLGREVIVVGAGNSAMDAARAAKRLVGDGQVTLVYRRTRREMPAAPEEIVEALEEGIALVELASPEAVVVENGRVAGLEVAAMKLGPVDESGRARPVKVPGQNYRIKADSIIVAIGQNVRLDVWPEKELKVDLGTGATPLAGIYTGGDAGRGASSLIQAIADGHMAAASIARVAAVDNKWPAAPQDGSQPDNAALRVKKAHRAFGPTAAHKAPAARMNFEMFTSAFTTDQAKAEAARCLECDKGCGICATVCPNRANLALPGHNLSYPVQSASLRDGQTVIETTGLLLVDQDTQVINLADFCNECGNCAFFCPSAGAPYRDKPKVHLSRKSFDESGHGYYLAGPGELLIQHNGQASSLVLIGDALVYECDKMTAKLNKDNFEALDVVFKNGTVADDLTRAAEAAVIWTLIKDRQLFLG